MAVFKCKMCGGEVDFHQDDEVAFCDSCGTKYNVSDFVIENDELKIQKLKYKEEQERLRLQAEMENNRIKYWADKEKKEQQKAELETFKKSKYKYYLIISFGIAVLLAVLGFLTKMYFSAVVLSIMAALFLIAFLMRMQIIPEGRKGISTLLVIIAILLTIPFFAAFDKDMAMDNAREEKEYNDRHSISWASLVMGDVIPTPEQTVGYIWENNNKKLRLEIEKVPSVDYYSYVEHCQEEGFTTDVESDEDSFNAWNQDGYKIEMTHWEASEILEIELKAPTPMSSYSMPDNKLGKMIPPPSSKSGNLEEKENSLFLQVENTTLDDYHSYVADVEKRGFRKEKNKEDKYFKADNSKGHTVKIEYIGNNIMTIYLYKN